MVGLIVLVGEGGRVSVKVGCAAAVCEMIALAVIATTVGICSSGINVGNGAVCGPSLQLESIPNTKNTTLASAICPPDCAERFGTQGESGIAGCVFFNER